MERLTDKNHNAINKCGEYSSCYSCHKETCYISELEQKLGELEDVLESWHIESLEELKTRLHDCQVYHLENNSNETLIHNLKNELAELKQKAIVPKYKLGQEVWVNDWTGQLRIGRIYEVQTNAVLHDQRLLITYLVDFYGNYEDDDRENDYYEEKEVFATKEEAEQKLAEIGEKDE